MRDASVKELLERIRKEAQEDIHWRMPVIERLLAVIKIYDNELTDLAFFKTPDYNEWAADAQAKVWAMLNEEVSEWGEAIKKLDGKEARNKDEI